jgi:pilus assembly protein CpaF
MESDVITLQNLFEFKVESVTQERVVIGSLRSTGLRPTFLHKFEKRGISLPLNLFSNGSASGNGAAVSTPEFLRGGR